MNILESDYESDELHGEDEGQAKICASNFQLGMEFA